MQIQEDDEGDGVDVDGSGGVCMQVREVWLYLQREML